MNKHTFNVTTEEESTHTKYTSPYVSTVALNVMHMLWILLILIQKKIS